MLQISDSFKKHPVCLRLIKYFPHYQLFEWQVLILSLFVVIYFSYSLPFLLKAPLALILITSLFSFRFLRSPWMWLLVGLVLFAGNISEWYLVDNHRWLFVLWAITISSVYFCIEKEKRIEVLANNAKWLFILVMLFAVLQKAFEPSYVDGSFFAYTLLTDVRFQFLSHNFAGISMENLLENQGVLSNFLISPELVSASLHTNSLVSLFGHIITWWVFVTELVIGLLFLLTARWAHLLGHIISLHFIFLTYIFAPVFGFGSLLAVMGILLSYKKHPGMVKYYLMALAYLFLLSLPLGTVLMQG